VNDQFMGNHFNTAALDDATMAMIKRKTRMKSSEISNWYSELKVMQLFAELMTTTVSRNDIETANQFS
jgi:hypothetical protein